MHGDKPFKFFFDKRDAHAWVEDLYGSGTDGIVEAGVSVQAFWLDPCVKEINNEI